MATIWRRLLYEPQLLTGQIGIFLEISVLCKVIIKVQFVCSRTFSLLQLSRTSSTSELSEEVNQHMSAGGMQVIVIRMLTL